MKNIELTSNLQQIAIWLNYDVFTFEDVSNNTLDDPLTFFILF